MDGRSSSPTGANAAAAGLARLSPAIGALAIVLGVAVLLGWALHIAALTSVFPDLATMKPNTALGFVLLGLALIGASRRAARGWWVAAQVCASGAAAIGVVTLGEYLLGIETAFDVLLFADYAGTPLAGRMSPVTASNFVLLGISIVVLVRGGSAMWCQLPALIAGLGGLLSALGYAYGVESLHTVPGATQIAVHTACMFVLLAFAVLCATRGRGWMRIVTQPGAGGMLARRLIPITVLGPIVLGALRLAGQRAGVYGTEFGLALMVVALVIVATALVYATATRIDASEREREQHEEQLRQAQKLESVGRLAGGIAHDFNNLLSVILGYGELLLEDLRDRAHARQLVEECIRAAQRAASLTSQLLAFSRRQIIQPTVLDPNAVVTDIERLLRRILGEDIALHVVLEPELGRVKADRGQLEQVLLNLAANARDAMPTGGQLTIETANVELDELYVRTHAGAKAGPHVMLAASDTGHGMDAETRAHIFEPFFTTKELGRGTGLGLATVYGVVQQNGGSIWVYSEPGRGATFKVYLPRCDEQPTLTSAATASVEERLRGHETVLIVEDEPAILTLEQTVLSAAGYAVLTAASGRQALEVAARCAGPIDLLVTDVVMPGMSGRELADALVRERPNLAVLYASGYTENTVVHHGILEPGIVYAQKPLTPTALRRKVREVLDAAKTSA